MTSQRRCSACCAAPAMRRTPRERGVPLKPGLIALIERCYDGILANGLAFHEAQPPWQRPSVSGQLRRVGYNLLLRLSTRKQDARFLTDPSVLYQQLAGARWAHDEIGVAEDSVDAENGGARSRPCRYPFGSGRRPESRAGICFGP